ncbi:hypothetical protein ACFQFH_07295 [Halobaculum halobium]|uniref:Cox cluster protein n=1 Tax=Halobaculum halobium TaxID=3032281 RepID=A0ABD5T9I5_9EURY|nr:hypothetical protein [Halobaculum sp. SYNS20]
MSDRGATDGVDDSGGDRPTGDPSADDGHSPRDSGGATDDGGLIEGEPSAVEASGRPYLIGAAAVVTLFAAAAGYVVAANNAVGSVTVFGAVTVPGTPTAVAAYGAVLSLAVLGVLFGLVTVAARFDDDAVN